MFCRSALLLSCCKNRFGFKNESKPALDAYATNKHLVNCYSDDDRSSVFESLDDLPTYDDPTSAFQESPPYFSELTSALKRKHNNSAQWPNCVPYIVWKMCPSLQKRLLTVFFCKNKLYQHPGNKLWSFTNPGQLKNQRISVQLLWLIATERSFFHRG